MLFFLSGLPAFPLKTITSKIIYFKNSEIPKVIILWCFIRFHAETIFLIFAYSPYTQLLLRLFPDWQQFFCQLQCWLLGRNIQKRWNVITFNFLFDLQCCPPNGNQFSWTFKKHSRHVQTTHFCRHPLHHYSFCNTIMKEYVAVLYKHLFWCHFLINEHRIQNIQKV